MLQETYCKENCSKKFEKGWNGKIVHSFSDSNHSRGVTILFNNSIAKRDDFNIIDTHVDKEGRRIIINVEIKKEIWCFVNMYCPTNEMSRKMFMSEILK